MLNKLYRYAPDNTDSKYRMALFLLPMQLSFQISHTQTSLLETLSKIVSPLALLSFSAPAEDSGVRSTPGTLTVLQLMLLSSHGATSSLLAWGALLGMGQGTKCKRKPWPQWGAAWKEQRCLTVIYLEYAINTLDKQVIFMQKVKWVGGTGFQKHGKTVWHHERLYGTERVRGEPLHACTKSCQLQLCLRSRVQGSSSTGVGSYSAVGPQVR